MSRDGCTNRFSRAAPSTSPSSRGTARGQKVEGSKTSTVLGVHAITWITASGSSPPTSTDRILDPVQRARVLNRADARLARDVPTIPLFEVRSLVAVRSTVRDFVPNHFDWTWHAENWWLDG